MKNLILASTSTLHNQDYLEYLLPTLEILFGKQDRVLFIPYARPGGISHAAYTKVVKTAFKKIDKNVAGIHTIENPVAAIRAAEAIFIGGGNTFVLVNALYRFGLMEILKEKITDGTPYLGTSAGSNIAGQTMETTNDMPIAYPPSYKTLGVIPFNINAHYFDKDPDDKHQGESRATRIKEFHTYHDTPVIGLREGSWLRVIDENVILEGKLEAKMFRKDKPVQIIDSKNSIVI